jgi:AcrR family transcriptional regulator
MPKTTSRGDKTRNNLLEVGTRLFSERGFAAVSTREIATAAATTLPSISHHFGSKEGLYRAVLQNVSEQMEEQFSLASAEAIGFLKLKRVTRQQRLDALQVFLSSVTRTILQSSAEWVDLITQEERLPAEALKPIEQVIEKQVLRPIMRLIASLRGQSPTSGDVKLQAISLLGRVLILRTRRSATLRLLNWQELTPLRIERIAGTLRSEVDAIFGDRIDCSQETPTRCNISGGNLSPRRLSLPGAKAHSLQGFDQ